MNKIYILILAMTFVTGSVQSTVKNFKALYRAPSAPVTPLTTPSTTLPTTTTPTPAPLVAQAREGQGFEPSSPNPNTLTHETQPQLQYSTPYYYNPYVPAPQSLQPLTYRAYAPQAYNQDFNTEGQGVVQEPVSSGITSWFTTQKMTDALVGVVVLGLVGGGGTLLYQQFFNKVKSSRTMRELIEKIKSEDAGELTQRVMRAIRRYSELNNSEN